MITVYHNKQFMSMDFHFPKNEEALIQAFWNLKSGDLKPVARVATDSLDEAYRLTNNIDEPWVNNPEAEILNKTGTVRSTSVGDILETEDGKRYMVVGIGFTEIPDRRLIDDAPEKQLPILLGQHPSLDRLIEERMKKETACSASVSFQSLVWYAQEMRNTGCVTIPATDWTGRR